MISRGYLCVNTLVCATIVYESLTFVSAGFLLNEIKTVHKIQPDANRFKPKIQSSVSIIGTANMWLTNMHTQKQRYKKNKMGPAYFREKMNLSKNKDKVINTIKETRNDSKVRIKKEKWHKEVDMDNENYEDTIIVGQNSGEKWQEKHDNITDLQHIKNSIERHGRKDTVENILSSISSDHRIYEDEKKKASLNEWRGTYENIKLNKTSEEEQIRIIAQNRRKEKLERELKLLDIWGESRGIVSKPEYKIRTVMRKIENYGDNDDDVLGRNGHNMKVENEEDLLQIWNKGDQTKSREKLIVTTSRSKGTLFDLDYLDPAKEFGPISMLRGNGKKRYDNIIFSQYNPLGLWKVKEKKRENIDRANDYSFHGMNHLMSSLNLLSMWSARDKRRKSVRDSRVMGFIDRWDTQQHDIGSIL